MKLAETLRLVMQSSGLSVAALAKVSDVEASTVQRFLAGEADIPLSAGERLAFRLGLELLQEVPWEEHVEEYWPVYADAAWKEYLRDEGEDAWEEALASGDWKKRQRKDWEEETRETFEAEEKETWEENERQRLNDLPWVRIVEEE